MTEDEPRVPPGEPAQGFKGQYLRCWTYWHGLKDRTPSEHPNPTTKIGSKMGGEFPYPKMVPLVLTHSHVGMGQN